MKEASLNEQTTNNSTDRQLHAPLPAVTTNNLATLTGHKSCWVGQDIIVTQCYSTISHCY